MSSTLASQSTEAMGIRTSLFITLNFTSLVGNIMVCLAVYRNPRIRVTTHIYIVALAISDLLCAVGSMPFTVTTLASGEWIFGQTVCEIQAFIMYFVLNISPTTMGLAAFNRYMRIVKSKYYSTIFSKRRSNVVLASIWLSLASYLLTARCTGWLNFTFYSGYASCVISHISDKRKAIHYSLVISLYFALPLLVAIFCYYRVYQTIRHHNLDIIPSLQSRTRQARITLHEIKISKSLFLVIAGFVLCWLPMWSVVIVLRFYPTVTLDRIVKLIPVFLIYLSSTINPFIYASSNRAYKTEFRRMLISCGWKKCHVFRKKRRIEPRTPIVETTAVGAMQQYSLIRLNVETLGVVQE